MILRRSIVLFLVSLTLLAAGILILSRRENKTSPPSPIVTIPAETPAPPEAPPPVAETSPTPPPTPDQTELIEPTAEFKSRITKKPFGIYITPENSPVQPERFRGYHNAVDVEYEDVDGDVPVKAISDGVVVVSRTASGYGGVMVVRHMIKGEQKLVLYGHLDPGSMKKVDTQVSRGEQISILGDHKSSETDGERKHLHFAILAKSAVDLRGYVQQESELSGWHNPLDFYQ